MIPLNGLYKLVTVVVILSVGIAAAGAEAFSGDQVLGAKTEVGFWEPDRNELDWLAAIPDEILEREVSRRLERLNIEQSSEEQLALDDTMVQDLATRERRIRRIADLVPLQYRTMVLDQAERYGVDPRMLAAVALIESQWVVRARGSHGDSGLMQIVPGTAAMIADHMALREYDLDDPETNLAMGAWYLNRLYNEYGNWPQALAAYNGGPQFASRGIQHPYVLRVLSVYEKKGS